MPRLKTPGFVKALGGRQSSGYDGLESDAPHSPPAATSGALSHDQESSGGSPFDRSLTEQGSVPHQQKEQQQQPGPQESEHKEQSTTVNGKTAATNGQSKAGKLKKPWKGIGGKLRVGRSKIRSWEECESEMLRSPITSPTTEGKSFVGPAEASLLGNSGQPAGVASSSAIAHGDQRQPCAKQRQEVAAASASMFVARGVVEQQKGHNSKDIQLLRGKDDQCDNVVRALGSTSSSDCEPDNEDSFTNGADTGTASNSSAGHKAGSAATAEPKTKHQLDTEPKKKGRKLKLHLNFKSSLKRITNDLSRALKHNDGLNAQVTLASPPATAGGTATPPPAPLAVKVAAFKNMGGSLNGEDVEQRGQANLHGAGYNALDASYNGDENSSDDDEADDDVDEMSQPHNATRLTFSAHAPIRDGGFRPL